MNISVTLNSGDIVFQNGRRLEISLHPSTVEIQPGTIVLLKGPNGGGKSSFLRAISGVYRDYFDPGSRPETSELAVWRKDGQSRRIVPRCTPLGVSESIRGGFLSQSPRANVFCENVEEEIAFSLEHAGLANDEVSKRLSQALADLEKIGISKAAKPHKLSKGQQQLVGFLALMQAEPEVLFLDEPSAALDDNALECVLDKLDYLINDGRLALAFIASQDDRLLTRLKANERVLEVELHGSTTLASNSSLSGIMESGDLNQAQVLGLIDIKCMRDDFEVELPEVRLEPGQGLLINGGNGSGKSTLLDAITGYRRAKKGDFIYGDSRWRAGRKSCSAKVAYAFQNADEQILFSSCNREVQYPQKRHGWNASCRQSLLRSGIDFLSSPWHLSFGQRKLLTYYSLAFSSPIWAIDEPFASLDDSCRGELVDIIDAYLNSGGIFIMTASYRNPEIDQIANLQQVSLPAARLT